MAHDAAQTPRPEVTRAVWAAVLGAWALLGAHAWWASADPSVVHGVDATRWMGGGRVVWLTAFALALGVAPVQRAVGAAGVACIRRLATPVGAAASFAVVAATLLILRDHADPSADAGFLVDDMRGMVWRSSSHPLDRVLHLLVWRELSWVRWVDDPRAVYVGLSTLGGVAWWGATLVTLRRLPLDDAGRAMALASALSSGALAVFFGHVEVYASDAAVLTLGMACAVRAVGGLHGMNSRDAGMAGLLFGLAGALHGRSLWAALGVVALSWLGRAQVRTALAPWVGWGLGLASAPVSWAALSIAGQTLKPLGSPGGGDGVWLVPLWTPTLPYAPFTLGSPEHLRDVVNALALMVPLVLSALAVAMSGSRPDAGARRVNQVLAASTVGVCLLVGLWNPDFGAEQDWDVFSIAGTVGALSVGVWAASRAPVDARLRVAGVWCLTAVAVNGPWIVGRALGLAR